MYVHFDRARREHGLLVGALAGIATMTVAFILVLTLAPSPASAETPAQRCKRETAAYNAGWAAIGRKPPAPYKCGGSNKPPPTLSPAEPGDHGEETEEKSPPEKGTPDGADTGRSGGPSLKPPTERNDNASGVDPNQPSVAPSPGMNRPERREVQACTQYRFDTGRCLPFNSPAKHAADRVIATITQAIRQGYEIQVRRYIDRTRAVWPSSRLAEIEAAVVRARAARDLGVTGQYDGSVKSRNRWVYDQLHDVGYCNNSGNCSLEFKLRVNYEIYLNVATKKPEALLRGQISRPDGGQFRITNHQCVVMKDDLFDNAVGRYNECGITEYKTSSYQILDGSSTTMTRGKFHYFQATVSIAAPEQAVGPQPAPRSPRWFTADNGDQWFY